MMPSTPSGVVCSAGKHLYGLSTGAPAELEEDEEVLLEEEAEEEEALEASSGCTGSAA